MHENATRYYADLDLDLVLSSLYLPHLDVSHVSRWIETQAVVRLCRQSMAIPRRPGYWGMP